MLPVAPPHGSPTSYTGQYDNLILAYFGQANFPVARAIMLAESGGNPRAISRTNDYGLFQMNNGLVNFGSAIFDPETNIKIAYEHYFLHRGWQPWSTFKNRSYLRYL